jgi:hypothetical protein
MELAIFRTGNNGPKVTRSIIDRTMTKLSLKARVKRPSLTDFFLPAKAGSKSDFYRLPMVPQSIIDSPAARVLSGPNHPNEDAPMGARWVDQGWIVPTDSLGRAQRVDNSTAESVRLWIKTHLADVADPGDVAVLVID